MADHPEAGFRGAGLVVRPAPMQRGDRAAGSLCIRDNRAMKRRSVELTVPQPAAAADFLQKVWRLTPVSEGRFRGAGTHPWILSFEKGEPAIRSITFSGSAAEVKGRTELRGPEG